MRVSGHYAQCPCQPEQITKSQSDRPLIPDWQPGRGHGPGILVTALPDNRNRSHCGHSRGVVSALWGRGDVMQQLLSVVTVLWFLGTSTPTWHCNNGIYQTLKTNLKMSKARKLFLNVRKVRRKMLMAHNWTVLRVGIFLCFCSWPLGLDCGLSDKGQALNCRLNASEVVSGCQKMLKYRLWSSAHSQEKHCLKTISAHFYELIIHGGSLCLYKYFHFKHTLR